MAAQHQQAAQEDLRRRQQQIMEQQKKMMEMRQKQEEMRRMQEEQQKRVMEERRMEQQRKMQEMKAAQEAEAQRRQEEMARKREEQRATMAIRRVIQKLRFAKEEDLTELEGEVRAEINKELANCGSQVDKIQEEANKAVEQAKARINLIKEQQRKEEERKAAEEKKRQEALEKAEALCKELLGLVEANTAAAATLEEKAKRLSDDNLDEAAIEKASKEVEDAREEARLTAKACAEFMAKHATDLKGPPGIPAKGTTVKPPGAPEEPAADDKPKLAQMVSKINDTNKQVDGTARNAKVQAEAALRKAAAKTKLEKFEATFKKYATKDVLNEAAVKKYAQGAFGMALKKEDVDRIMRTLAADGKTIAKEDFQLVKVAVGVAKEKQMDEKRRAAREANEKRLADLKEALSKQLEEAAGPADKAIETVVKAEARSRTTAAEVAAASAVALLEQATEAEELAKEAKDLVTAAKKTVEELSEGTDEELKFWLMAESKKIMMKLKPLDLRLQKVSMLTTKLKEQGKKKDVEELTKVRELVVANLRYHQSQKKLTGEELFDEIAKNERIEESDFVEFINKCDKPPKEGENAEGAAEDSGPEEKALKRLFEQLDVEEAGHLDKSTFLRLIRQFFKVVKDTVLTVNLSIKEGKSVRRMECGEVIEVLKGPMPESDGGALQRVFAKCMKDGQEGWVTVEGNQGSKYIQEGGNIFKVVKETILTESCDIGGGSKESARKLKDTTRKLKEGELVEVLEWPKKEEESGLMRMQCRAKSDGTVGWATTVGTTGIVFLQVV